jgi:hypothetical protein
MLWGLAIAALGLLAACSTPAPSIEYREVMVTFEVPVEVTRVVELTAVPAARAPYEDVWAKSAHADASAEAFAHWNNDNPAEVPVSCAKCHGEPGFRDFLGLDGSAFGTVDKPAPAGAVIGCDACHNDAASAMTSVDFPSGAEIAGLGAEARCMQCHQGRASMVQVNSAIERAGLADDDTVSTDLGFTNIHYYAAAVSRYGSQVKGGYEYAGRQYDVLFEHVAGFDTCIGCHDSHSLEVKLDACSACHGVDSVEDLRDVRMEGSLVDYDGDGDLSEGLYYELEGVRARLYQGMQAYASQVAGMPLVYSADTYPYFFIDLNENGLLDDNEVVFDNKYINWTGRLAKAAYNYQTSLKDPGAYAHGGKYIIQLLYDSLDDLNDHLGQPVDMTAMRRDDPGHFAGSTEAFRHWDAEGAVPGTCAKCHSADGLPTFLANNANIAAAPSSGFACETCHSSLSTYARYTVNSVRFPSGATLGFGDGADSNLCLNCHQGRESTVSVDTALRGLALDESSDRIRFRNIHYFAAGATLFGDQAKGAYQYEGQSYLGQFTHGSLGPTQCVACHDTHELEVRVDRCNACHTEVRSAADLRNIRGPSDVDYDGDGDDKEGIAGEISTMEEALYAALQAYAADKVGTGILYSGAAYPYFFIDTNGNGLADPDEIASQNGYNAWTPRMLKAAYNLQYVKKDPGAYSHNSLYILQVLYDSLNDIGGDVTGMTRP